MNLDIIVAKKYQKLEYVNITYILSFHQGDQRRPVAAVAKGNIICVG